MLLGLYAKLPRVLPASLALFQRKLLAALSALTLACLYPLHAWLTFKNLPPLACAEPCVLGPPNEFAALTSLSMELLRKCACPLGLLDAGCRSTPSLVAPRRRVGRAGMPFALGAVPGLDPGAPAPIA